jgi:hypothetical protein
MIKCRDFRLTKTVGLNARFQQRSQRAYLHRPARTSAAQHESQFSRRLSMIGRKMGDKWRHGRYKNSSEVV